jgi:hypothetical protein
MSSPNQQNVSLMNNNLNQPAIGEVHVLLALENHIIHFLPLHIEEVEEIHPICSIDFTFAEFSKDIIHAP